VSGRLAIEIQRASLQHIPGRNVAVGTAGYYDTGIFFDRLQVVERSAKGDPTQLIISQTV
jgi:hypothetical protein